ncbi:Cu-Zn family superoxide dismutase [Actinoplanes lutulentus]|uniref:superoxide dismutase family protein n=1 Tax=Actinoplanes lutulentus TaxID=1287878 RepID=UPI0017BF954E|nr:superoxide dismutase family protein [Actinoplanes lutulentus]MBB2941455.1 Cu-Zn family superoxide dismutase [Actinoplanes lutulentus]
MSAVPDAAPGLEPGPVSSGTFRAWREGATAVTYDAAAVPVGATAEVSVNEAAGSVTVKAELAGLVPGRKYGAHLHNNPCTADPAEAGPHYQHRVDPAAGPGKPSVDPVYANPANEIWLDFTTDAAGTAKATSVQQWRFDAARPPWSFVLHAEGTHTAHGEAGTAGARLACLTRDPVPAYVNQPGRG